MSEKPFDGRAYARRLTTQPGVYRMLDADGQVLYVGKAANLRNRVGSYFGGSASNLRTQTMLNQVAAIEISTTRTEGEALLLENELIKSLKPRYNVLLRDDKSYPWIYLSEDEFPRLAFHRGPQRMPGRYFGPYPSAHGVRDSLNLMQKLFRVRQCEDSFFRNRSRPCLQYQIKRCTAPCVGCIEPEEYAEDVNNAALFLEGQGQAVIDALAERMQAASTELDFERAAELRDQIKTLRTVLDQQHVAGAGGDMDIVAAAGEGREISIAVFFFRGGRNLGNRAFFPRNSGLADRPEVLRAFVSQYYLAHDLPPELVLGEAVEDRKLLEQVFADRAGRKVRILTRPRGEKARWLDLTRKNAQTALNQYLASHAGMRRRMTALAELLDLDESPERMECFDVSHSGGEAPVASCVVFDGNGPRKSDYRRFNIRGVTPGDDYAAIRQALERRYRRLKSGEGAIPDLLFIDGGKGQVGEALAVLEELQIDETQVIGVSKGPKRKAGDEVLVVGRDRRRLEPGADSIAGHLIQWIRDEAHRFAITGHRGQRGKARQRSTLEDIPGIGAKRRRNLLSRFGGLQGVLRAGVEELCTVEGISRSLAQRIYDQLHGK